MRSANQTMTRAVPLPAVAVLAALAFAAMYLVTALPRLAYPYDLDFIEDGMLMQSLRHAQGRPVFGPPSAEFMPNVYMPLYSALGGWLLALSGPGYLPLRALSFAATLATAGLIGFIAHRESGRLWISLTSAGLYLGGYRLTGFWYELARVDALHVALALAGLALGLYAHHTRRGLAVSAVVLALAFFTKQTALVFAAALGVYLWFTVGRRAAWFALVYAASTIIPFVALERASGGWFIFHVFGVATIDPIEAGRIGRYVMLELFGVMAGLSAMTVGAVIVGARRTGGARLLAEQPWFLGTAAAALVSGLGRAPVGGNLNNLMPVYALLCLAPALLARAWLGRPAARPAASAEALIAGLILLQFALGVYNPLRYIPTAAMRASGDRLIDRLRSTEGEVLVLMHPYYALLAGKEPSAQIIHLWYLSHYRGLPLPDDFVQRIQTQHYAAIVSDESSFETEPAIADLIRSYYAPAVTLNADEAPPTLTGVTVRPQVIYRPKRD